MCYDAVQNPTRKYFIHVVVGLTSLAANGKASEKTRIANPFGWLWTCLHGNGDVRPPLGSASHSKRGVQYRKHSAKAHDNESPSCF